MGLGGEAERKQTCIQTGPHCEGEVSRTHYHLLTTRGSFSHVLTSLLPFVSFSQVSHLHRRSAGLGRFSVHGLPLLHVRTYREVSRADHPAVPQTRRGVDELHHRLTLAQKGTRIHARRLEEDELKTIVT